MLEWMLELKDADRSRIIREAFAEVAATEAGAIVFMVLFEHLHFFREATGEAEQALNNYAKRLLTFFGPDAEKRMVEAMLRAGKWTNPQLEGEKNAD